MSTAHTASRWTRFLELPLLVKELNEQAVRPRTYVIRFVYGALLFIGACVMIYGDVGLGDSAAGTMGRGRGMFERLLAFQMAGICVFLPAITAGAFAQEKERNTLGLLLITSLSPWELVAQKLLSRLVPMLTFLLLSFPLMAVAYSFGGVTDASLWTGLVLLLVATVQIGAMSLFCSAYFSTTFEALASSYVLLGILNTMCPVFGVTFLLRGVSEQGTYGTLAFSAFPLAAAVLFTMAARVTLERRAFIPPRNVLLQVFKALDAYFNEANKVTGGVVLVKDGDPLPGDYPVAWRETAKKSLGTFRYLFRVMVMLELPILAACVSIGSGPAVRASSGAVHALLYALWCLAFLMVASHAAGVVSSERSRQTLEVLLTMPLSGSELLRQKLAGVRRLIRVLLVPYLTIFLFEVWWRQKGFTANFWLSIASVFVYLHLAAWLSLWIGLRFRSQVRAAFAAILAIAAWTAFLPGVRALTMSLLRMSDWPFGNLLRLFSPVGLIATATAVDLSTNPAPVIEISLMVLNLFLHLGALIVFRAACLRRADLLLGRLGCNVEERHWVRPMATEETATTG
jgi:ABC-type transport system involved in multi-copper enzyme maturation permease subunit